MERNVLEYQGAVNKEKLIRQFEHSVKMMCDACDGVIRSEDVEKEKRYMDIVTDSYWMLQGLITAMEYTGVLDSVSAMNIDDCISNTWSKYGR